LGDLGNNVEVGLLGCGLLEGHEHIVGDNVVLSKILLSPLSDVLEDGGLVLLE
jgi:hypothetical protein